MVQLPPHLSLHHATGIHPGEPVAQFEIGKYKNFVYLFIDWHLRKAAIIDPQADLSEIDLALKAHNLTLTSILLTHTHFDHVAGVPELLSRYSNLTVKVHPLDTHRLTASGVPSSRLEALQDNEVLKVGALTIRVLHTPGHSAGECCFLTETTPPYLFTGDTVFIRDCGRTDLETGSNDEMFQSLNRIRALPKETILLPGHHYRPECATTLERELSESPPFQCRSVQELASLP